MSKSRYLFLSILGAIALIWVITGVIAFSTWQFRKNGTEVIAVFIADDDAPDEVEQDEAMKARPDRYVVRYTYDGITYEKTLQGLNEDQLPISEIAPGDTIQAILDPNDPSRIYTKENYSSVRGAAVISILLLGVLGLTRLFK